MPLICLHGSFGVGSDWFDFAQRSGRSEVLCPDLPSHGKRFAESATSFDDLLHELGESLPERCDLIGYSLGGRLALGLALAHPSRIRSLVLESASPGLSEPQRSQRREHDDAGAVELQLDAATFLTKFWQADLFSSFRNHPSFGAECALRIDRALRSPAAIAQTYAALSPGRQPDYFDHAESLLPPLLFVAGALDAKYRVIGARFTSLVPEARFEVIEEAGHNAHFEQPEPFANCVTRFWGTLS